MTAFRKTAAGKTLLSGLIGAVLGLSALIPFEEASAEPAVIIGRVLDNKGRPVSGARVTLIDTKSEPPYDDVPQSLLDNTVRTTNSQGYFQFNMNLPITAYLLENATVGVRAAGSDPVMMSIPMNIHQATARQIAEIIFGTLVPTDIPSGLLEVISIATGIPVPQIQPLTTEFASQFGAATINVPEPATAALWVGGLMLLGMRWSLHVQRRR